MASMQGVATTIQEWFPAPTTLIISTARRSVVPAFMAAAYAQASPRLRSLISLKDATELVLEHGVVVILTDVVGKLRGGVVLLTASTETPLVCFAYLDEDLLGSGLAQAMTAILISHHVVMSDGREIEPRSVTGAHQVRAERALASMGFMACPLTCEAVEDPEAAERLTDEGPALWALPPEQLTGALETVLGLTLRAQWKWRNSNRSATILFNHPIVYNAQLREDLTAVVAARRSAVR